MTTTTPIAPAGLSPRALVAAGYVTVGTLRLIFSDEYGVPTAWEDLPPVGQALFTDSDDYQELVAWLFPAPPVS